MNQSILKLSVEITVPQCFAENVKHNPKSYTDAIFGVVAQRIQKEGFSVSKAVVAEQTKYSLEDLEKLASTHWTNAFVYCTDEYTLAFREAEHMPVRLGITIETAMRNLQEMIDA
jgi:hypothetical protein